MITQMIPTARDALTRFKVTLTPETSLTDALEKMVARRSLGAPVLDAEGRVLGVLTVKDCLRLARHQTPRALAEQRVAEHMSTLKATLGLDMDLFGVADVFLAGDFPVLPVLDHRKRLVGRISRLGVLKQILELERRMARARRRQEGDRQDRSRPTSIESMQNLASSHRPDQLAEVLRNRPR